MSQESRRARMRLGVLAVLGALALGVYIFLLFGANERALTVTFIDVGQGDATLIESPSGFTVLIDGGPDGSVLRGLSRELGFFTRELDLVIATHPDQDHIGGLVDVLERYEVAGVVRTAVVGESGIAREFSERVEQEGARITYAERGMRFGLGGGAVLTTLFPDRDPQGLESNLSSLVLHLSYGEHDVLLMGDAPDEIERYLLALGDELESDILKVGHHGSRTSTDEGFLAAVAPSYAVISAGRDSRYGHPHEEVLSALSAAGVHTKNTAHAGDVTFISDGRELLLR